MGAESIPAFHGDTLIASTWLEDYLKNSDFLPQTQQFHFFKSKFKDEALRWLNTLPLPQRSNFAALVEAFKRDFIIKPAAERKQREKKLRKRQQHLDTTASPSVPSPSAPFVASPVPAINETPANDSVAPATKPPPATSHSAALAATSTPSPTTHGSMPPFMPADACNQHQPAPSMRHADSPVSSVRAQSMPANAGVARMHTENTKAKREGGEKEREEEGNILSVSRRLDCTPIPCNKDATPDTPCTRATTTPSSILTSSPSTLSARDPTLDQQCPTSYHHSPAPCANAEPTPANAGVAQTNTESNRQQQEQLGGGSGRTSRRQEEVGKLEAGDSLQDTVSTQTRVNTCPPVVPSPARPLTHVPTSSKHPVPRTHNSLDTTTPLMPSAPPLPKTTTPRPTSPTPCANAQHVPANAGTTRTNADDAQRQEERERERTKDGRRKNGEGRGGEEEDDLQGDGRIYEEVSNLIPGLAVERPSTMQPPLNTTSPTPVPPTPPKQHRHHSTSSTRVNDTSATANSEDSRAHAINDQTRSQHASWADEVDDTIFSPQHTRPKRDFLGLRSSNADPWASLRKHQRHSTTRPPPCTHAMYSNSFFFNVPYTRSRSHWHDSRLSLS
ncbi:uncharacterized protein F5891DRAFT_1196220 [Suillus fuscotomentosus]|uniref:Retrotransposon gag domain-containing protein n=1 Tax=Suillus fuscotomentosus TaxID=1912939 RepID=A0AAD4HFH9_9AGAM|nr:uncharacterized protein F5891DRAFT_1196220 [Suillus fuscotomentosus]KAG1893594.1 hypothetical protein F5891DRAFT_1196220 [Suillus fuscotomentosus]